MDTKTPRELLKDNLYAAPRQALQDALTSAQTRLGRSDDPKAKVMLQAIHTAAGIIGDAFNDIASENIPLVGALRNLATRSVEIQRIASDLRPLGEIDIADRLCKCATNLKDRAAQLHNEARAAGGPAR